MSDIKDTLDEELGGSISKAEKFYEKNKRAVQIGVGVIVLAVAGFVYMNYSSAQKEAEANASLYKLENYFENDSFNLILNGDPKDPEAINAIDFVDEYSGTPAAQKAAYMAGKAYMEKGDFQTAIEYLEKFKLDDVLVRPHVIGLIGDCHVELNDLEKAADYYKRAANYSDNPYTAPKFLKKLGLVQENLEEYEAAAKTYSKIKKNYTESEPARDIEKYIARAKAKAGISSFE
jgi:TolA-binding protein